MMDIKTSKIRRKKEKVKEKIKCYERCEEDHFGTHREEICHYISNGVSKRFDY